MRDEEPDGGGGWGSWTVGCVGVLVAVALAVGLFFGVCSMMLRR